MPTISTENTDQLTHIITVNIAKEDYEKSLNDELKKIRAKAHLKGFRKGQVPMSYIKKMYGKSILAEELNRMAYNEVMKYLIDAEVETLGQPIPAEGQIAPELDLKTYQDYSFQFEIGLQPKVEVQGADKTTSLTLYDIEIEEELVEESIDRFRKENGVREPQDKVTAENDILFVVLTELEDGEPKEGGLSEKTAMISLEDISNEKLKKKILTLKKEDTFDTDIHDLIKEDQKDHVHKYLLGVDEDVQFNDTFRAQILSITNITPAELSAELLVQAIGMEKAEKHVGEFLPKEEEVEKVEVASEDSEDAIPEVVELDLEDDNSKEEEEKKHVVTDAERKAAKKGFKAEVAEMMREDFTKNAKARLLRDFRESVVEKNEVTLPTGYLKRWMEMNAEGNPVSDEEYKLTIEGLKWNILRDAIAKEAGVYVSYEEVEAEFKDRYFEMSGMSPDDPKADEQFGNFMQSMQGQGNFSMGNMHANRIQKDLEDKLEDIITIDKKSMTSKAYGEMLEEEYKEEQKKLETEKKEEEAVVDSSAE